MAGLFNPFSNKRKQRGGGSGGNETSADAPSPGTSKGKASKSRRRQTQDEDVEVVQVIAEQSEGRAASNRTAGRSKKDLLTSSETLQKHALLFGLLERKCLKLSEANALCERITGSKETLFQLLGTMNKELGLMQVKVKTAGVPSYQYQEGREGEGEMSNSEVYVSIINIAKDEASNQSCKLTFAEMSYFKQMIEAMLQKPDLSASMIELLNLELVPATSQAPSQANGEDAGQGTQTQAASSSASTMMTKKNKEGVVLQLAKDAWLRQVGNNRKFTLGPRTFLELKPLLLKMDLPPVLVKVLN